MDLLPRACQAGSPSHPLDRASPHTGKGEQGAATCFLSASKAALMVCTRVRSLAFARSLRVCCRALISEEVEVASPGRFLGDDEASGWLL